MRRGGPASLASRGGSDSRMMAWAVASVGTAGKAQSKTAAARAPRSDRARIFSAPVVEHQVVRALVVVLLASLHAHHGEIGMVAALEQALIGRPVVRVHGRDHALQLGGMRHVLHGAEERVQVLGLAMV